MANNFGNRGNIFSANDALDINELASLNDDFSNDFLDQLQNQIAQSANIANDGAMFEETPADSNNEISESNATAINPNPPSRISLNDSFDDNFIKKYKAKLNKQELVKEEKKEEPPALPEPEVMSTPLVAEVAPVEQKVVDEQPKKEESPFKKALKQDLNPQKTENSDIEKLSSGNISEKPLDVGQIEYNDSLDLLDGNVKYSKYVIYIDPENTEFIESLTVKERKNLINKILKEQDVIVTTKNRFRLLKKIIKHAIVAVITITIFVPFIYFLINVSLEATINNYQRSKDSFKVLYKEKGKIQKNLNY